MGKFSVLLIVMLVLAGCGQVGDTSSGRGSGRHVAGVGEAWPVRVDDLKMQDVSGLAYKVSASATNTTAGRICWVRLTFEFLDAGGAVQGNCDEYVVTDECMAAGQRLTVNRQCDRPEGATQVRVGQVHWQD
jgi:hypothetical protein